MKLLHFFTDGIWDANLTSMGWLRRFIYRLCRIVVLAIRGFNSDKCTMTASALTYITLISLVPVLAVTLSFCKGLGFQDRVICAVGLEKITSVATKDGKSVEWVEYRVIQPSPGGEPHKPGKDVARATADSAKSRGLIRSLMELAKGENDEFMKKAAWASSLPEPMQQALIQLFTYVEHTNFKALGLVGLIAMLVTVILSIHKLEREFNAIWCVKRGRTFIRQTSEYLIVLLLTPMLLLIVASLVTFAVQGGVARALNATGTMAILFGQACGYVMAFAALTACFLFLYMFMPNTKVCFKSALLGALVAAVLWSLVLWMYFKWQVGLTKLNTIYGSFAALPFFLAWLYATWNVVLLGVEMTYSVQNCLLLRKSKSPAPMAPAACYLLGVVAMNEICQNFANGKVKWNAAEYAGRSNISIKELDMVLQQLCKVGLAVQMSPMAEGWERYDYMPAVPVESITLAEVADAFVGLYVKDSERILERLPSSVVELLRQNHELGQRALAVHKIVSLQ